MRQRGARKEDHTMSADDLLYSHSSSAVAVTPWHRLVRIAVLRLTRGDTGAACHSRSCRKRDLLWPQVICYGLR